MRSLSDISRQRIGHKSARIRAEISPIAYFMVKARRLNGFSLFALSGRDLIINEGPAAIPALLVACSAMPEGLKHFSLSPSDIFSSPERYFKHNGQKLAEATKDGYGRFLKNSYYSQEKYSAFLGMAAGIFSSKENILSY